MMSLAKSSIEMSSDECSRCWSMVTVLLFVLAFLSPSVSLADNIPTATKNSKQAKSNQRNQNIESSENQAEPDEDTNSHRFKCTEEDIASSKAYKESGKLLWQSKKFEAAAADYQRAYQFCRLSVSSLFGAAQSYRFAEKTDTAIRLYENFQKVACLDKTENTSNVGSTPLYSNLCAEASGYLQDLYVIQQKELQLRRPVWKKGWFWGALSGGAVLAATAITLGVVFGTQDRREVVRF